MRRILIGGILLLVCGVITALSLPAVAGKGDPLMFVFVRVDREQGVAILRPMIALDIGVQLDSGRRDLKPGTVLRCAESSRTHDAIVETQISTISEMLLDCGDYKFVVKTLDFSPHSK
jgi:hypothetical protein